MAKQGIVLFHMPVFSSSGSFSKPSWQYSEFQFTALHWHSPLNSHCHKQVWQPLHLDSCFHSNVKQILLLQSYCSNAAVLKEIKNLELEVWFYSNSLQANYGANSDELVFLEKTYLENNIFKTASDKNSLLALWDRQETWLVLIQTTQAENIAKRGDRENDRSSLRRHTSKLLFSASYGQHSPPLVHSICFLLRLKNISLINSTGWKTTVWVTHWGGSMIIRDTCWSFPDLVEHQTAQTWWGCCPKEGLRSTGLYWSVHTHLPFADASPMAYGSQLKAILYLSCGESSAFSLSLSHLTFFYSFFFSSHHLNLPQSSCKGIAPVPKYPFECNAY